MKFRRAVLALVLAFVCFAAFAQDADFKVGDKIEILYDNKWYPGVVKKTGDKQWYVHYDGYGDSWDTWMPADRLRRAGAGGAGAKVEPATADAAADATADPVVGERCEGSWNQSWYEIEILEVKNGKYFVHWRGYGKDSDEWLGRDRIRRKGEDKEVLPRKGREGNGGGAAAADMVGKEVEVFWHGKWWPATVKQTDGKRFFIRYAGESFGKMEEWAVAERVREVGGAARVKVDPAGVPGKKGLSGLWWRQYGKPGQMIVQHFVFFPDGRVFMGFPDNPDDLDWASHQKRFPGGCGGYGLDGDKLNIEFGGDADEWKPLTFERVSDDEWKLNGIPTLRPRQFPKGFRLEGKYVNIDAAEVRTLGGADGVSASKAVVYVFRKDGTFELEGNAVFGAGAAGVHDANDARISGTYEIAGNHITHRFGGAVASILAYPMGHEDAPYEMIRIGPQIMKLRKD